MSLLGFGKSFFLLNIIFVHAWCRRWHHNINRCATNVEKKRMQPNSIPEAKAYLAVDLQDPTANSVICSVLMMKCINGFRLDLLFTCRWQLNKDAKDVILTWNMFPILCFFQELKLDNLFCWIFNVSVLFMSLTSPNYNSTKLQQHFHLFSQRL